MPTPEEEREADERHEIWNEEDDSDQNDEDEDSEGSILPPQANTREIV